MHACMHARVHGVRTRPRKAQALAPARVWQVDELELGEGDEVTERPIRSIVVLAERDWEML